MCSRSCVVLKKKNREGERKGKKGEIGRQKRRLGCNAATCRLERVLMNNMSCAGGSGLFGLLNDDVITFIVG